MSGRDDGRPATVLIGGRGRHEFAAVRDLGQRIVYLDTQVPLSVMSHVDVPIDVDLDDVDAVEAAVRSVCGHLQLAGVLTHTEPRLPLMATLRGRLGLPERGLSLAAAQACRDKLRTRELLAGAGVPSPKFRFASDVAGAEEAAQALGFPVVIKPRDGAGGLGVRWCADTEQVRQAAHAALTLNTHLVTLPGLLVEQYVTGPEFAVQTVTRRGDTEVLSVLAQRSTPPPVFVELAYDYPSGLPTSELAAVTQVIRAGLRAVGLDNWISHTQVRIGPDGPQIIEINARRPGGRLVELTEVVSGVDMIRAATELALGYEITTGQPVAACAGYRSLVFDEAGMLLYNSRLESVPFTGPVAPIVEVDIPAGDPVQAVDHPDGGVYGRIVAFGNRPEEVAADLDRVREALDPQVLALTGDEADLRDAREFKSCC